MQIKLGFYKIKYVFSILTITKRGKHRLETKQDDDVWQVAMDRLKNI